MGVTNPRRAFYLDVLRTLTHERVPFVVGGAFAVTHYCGLRRPTKDLDLFIREADWAAASAALTSIGMEAFLPFPHWLGKARRHPHVVDLIFNSGNGLARVDDLWMTRAPRGEVFGVPVPICPPEEMIWTKAFVMERERFDGADVLHLLRAVGRSIDWAHLRGRFGSSWRVLLAHLVLYNFVYPGETETIPQGVMVELLERLANDVPGPNDRRLCRGTLVSRAQYLVDVEKWGYLDARRPPFGHITAEDMRTWTEEIHPAHRPVEAG
jgi:hypothetical protein